MRRKRQRWLRWAVALVIVGGIAVWMTRPMWRGVEVDVISPRVGPVVQTVVSSGRVRTPTRLRLGANVGGTVVTVTAREGQHVDAGATLVTLDDASARADVARAEAALDAVAARRQALESKLAPSAREALRRARTQLAQATRDAERDRTLATKGAKTRVEAEQAETALALARSQLRQALLDARATSESGAEQAALAAAEADARAALDAARTGLTNTRVVSPVAGVVLTRSVEPGDVAQPGAPLLVIAGDGPDELVIEPDEKNLEALAVGQRAVASADAYPERRFDAEVAWIAPAVDPRRGTIEVRLTLPTPIPELRPDMTVSVEVEVARAEEALTVPRAALRDLASEEPWALIVVDGQAERREVTLGLRGDDVVEVSGGLTAGDRLILPERGGADVGAKVVGREPGGG